MPLVATKAARAELAAKGIQALNGMLDLLERSPLNAADSGRLEAARQCVSIIAHRRDKEGLSVCFSDQTE